MTEQEQRPDILHSYHNTLVHIKRALKLKKYEPLLEINPEELDTIVDFIEKSLKRDKLLERYRKRLQSSKLRKPKDATDEQWNVTLEFALNALKEVRGTDF